MQFRLITYNIHKGIGGVDRRYRLERIVQVLAPHRPDVVFLQEVDDGVPRSSHHRQVDLLAEALGLTWQAFQPNVRVRRGHYGNAILSRFPLEDVHDLELTVGWKKRRRALVARCQLPTPGAYDPLLLCNFHLGLAGFERKIQLRRFLASEALSSASRSSAVIAAGDFNDIWGTLGRRILEPAGFAPALGHCYTFPAFLPLRPLDRVYYRGSLRLVDGFVCRKQATRKASDHLPIVTDFRLHFDLPN